MLLHPLNDDAEQAERPARSTIYAQRHGPANARCESIVPGEDGDPYLCDKPADYTHARRFQDAGHYWWRHHPICESCASKTRRTEIDRRLQEIGAHVIQVKDLGAALEAREVGGLAIQQLTSYATGSVIGSLIYGTYQAGRVNAHVAIQHARVALGEV